MAVCESKVRDDLYVAYMKLTNKCTTTYSSYECYREVAMNATGRWLWMLQGGGYECYREVTCFGGKL